MMIDWEATKYILGGTMKTSDINYTVTARLAFLL